MMNKLVEKALERAAQAAKRDYAKKAGATSLADLSETRSHSKFPVTEPIQQALAEETGLVHERPGSAPPPGWGNRTWDVCLWSDATEQPALVAEIKWYRPASDRGAPGHHVLKYARQDIFKLGRAVEQRTVERGYMIVGAPVPWWDKVRASDDPWIKDLIVLLEAGCDLLPADHPSAGHSLTDWWQDRPDPQPPPPRAITLSPLRSARIEPIGDEDCWELRCVRVTA